MTNREKMLLFEKCINTNDLELGKKLISPSASFATPVSPEPLYGAEGYLSVVSLMRQSFPDAQWKLVEAVSEGNTVAAQWECSGTFEGPAPFCGLKPNGRKFSTTVMNFYTFDDEGMICKDVAAAGLAGIIKELRRAGTERNIEEAREFFKGDRFATENGMVIEELDSEHAVTSVVLSDRHKNALGGVMGGAIFTLADFAFAALTNDKERATVAQQVSINYLSAPKGAKLIATARYKKDGRNSCVVNIDVTDDMGREVAQFVGTGFKLSKDNNCQNK